MSAVFIHRSTSSMAPQHFLVVAFPGQGHINPARALAERLARATPGARVTLSAAVSAHRRMFPSLASPDDEVHDGAISYVPYSDGYDHGFSLFAGDGDEVERYTEAFGRVGRETFSAVLDRLAARGRPVTCVVYAMLMWWAAEVARERGLPRALYWIQPATMLAVYYHYFHGYEKVVTEHAAKPEFTVSMPGLVPMAIRDLPSFFTNLTDGRLVAAFGDIRRTFQQLDLDVCSSSGSAGGSRRAMVLVNTVEELEAGALASVPELDVFPVGPAVVSFSTDGEGAAAAVGDLFEHDDKGYMEWLDTKPARSVVYVSFGSMSAVSKRQKNELQRGLAASGMSYLWVVRNNNRDDGFDAAGDVRGMVVGWCDQVRVLSHPAVGCFVTHCGWNSTLEALACGAPVVAVPQWSDQDTNARLVVQWGIGVRAMTDVDRLLVAEELARCLVTIMGDREEGAVIRASSAAWKAKLRQAIADGGSSGRNLRTFLNKFANDA